MVDLAGAHAWVAAATHDPTQLEVRLENGAGLIIPRLAVTNEADGSFRFKGTFAETLAAAQTAVVIPVVEEAPVIGKRLVERDRVRLRSHVTTREEPVKVALVADELQVDRVPIERVVDHAEPPRQEGDTYVMPVYEEVLVVEKRLMLKEEVRVTRVRRERLHEERVELRRADVRVERRGSNGSTPGHS
jgi:stress response protein YsnF